MALHLREINPTAALALEAAHREGDTAAELEAAHCAAALHAAEGVCPQLVGREGLDGGEDDVVDAGPEHEEGELRETELVLGGRDDELADAEEEELDEPGDEVAGARDGVLARPLHGHVAPARGEEGGRAPVQPDQLPYDDDEEDELEEVGQQAEGGAEVVEDGLELLHVGVEVGEEGVEDHAAGGLPEKEGLCRLPRRQDERDGEAEPLGASDEPADAHPEEDVVELDVEDANAGDDEAAEGAVGHTKHYDELHEQAEWDDDDSAHGVLSLVEITLLMAMD